MKDRLNSYFLGDLSKEEEIRLEEEFFADDEKYLQFEATQNDLIDAYIKKQLSLEEQKKFEKYLKASPGLRKRVEIAQALALHIAKITDSKTESKEIESPNLSISWWKTFTSPFTLFNSTWRVVFATSTILAFLLALTWAIFEQQRLKQLIEKQQNQLSIEKQQYQEENLALSEKIKSEQENASKIQEKVTNLEKQIDDLKQQLAKNYLPKLPLVSFELDQGGNRSIAGGETKVLKLSAKTEQLVQLKIKTLYTLSEVNKVVLKHGDDISWQPSSLKNSIKQAKGFLIVEIPSKKFNNNIHTLEITYASGGPKPYIFSVKKE